MADRWLSQVLDALMKVAVFCWIFACIWYFLVEDISYGYTAEDPNLDVGFGMLENHDAFPNGRAVGINDDSDDEERSEAKPDKLIMGKRPKSASIQKRAERWSNEDFKRNKAPPSVKRAQQKQAEQGDDDMAEPVQSTKRRSSYDAKDEDISATLTDRNKDLEKKAEAETKSDELIKKNKAIFSEPAMQSPAIVVMTYNRPDYLRTTLESLASLTGLRRYKVYVSQDGNSTAITDVLDWFPDYVHLQRERLELVKGQGKTAYIAQHYKQTLDRLFISFGHSHVVIVEDDMTFAPDFCQYFEQLAFLLDTDPSLWCISSWNDNGFEGLVEDTEKLFRTQYFPGLGWMLKRESWDLLSEKWPLDHWDNWLRFSDVMKGKECIYPEVSRNYNIGERGANLDVESYDRYFKRIKVNAEPIVVFGDLSYLLQRNYEIYMQHLFAEAVVISSLKERAVRGQGKIFLLPYLREDFKELAGLFRIWDRPRAHHNYTQPIRYQGSTFILADKRRTPYLPATLQEHPHPELVVLAGLMGEDCNARCATNNLRCFVHDFDFLNDCAILKTHFRCERGCGMETGDDIPNYVSGAEDQHSGKCLVSEGLPTCSARHRMTSRLCPCLPRTSSGAQSGR